MVPICLFCEYFSLTKRENYIKIWIDKLWCEICPLNTGMVGNQDLKKKKEAIEMLHNKIWRFLKDKHTFIILSQILWGSLFSPF